MTSLPIPSPGMTAIRFFALTRTKISEERRDKYGYGVLMNGELVHLSLLGVALNRFLSALVILRYNRNNTRENCLTRRFDAKPSSRIGRCTRGIPGLAFRLWLV